MGNNTMNTRINNILDELHVHLKRLYGERLIDLILYIGSALLNAFALEFTHVALCNRITNGHMFELIRNIWENFAICSKG